MHLWANGANQSVIETEATTIKYIDQIDIGEGARNVSIVCRFSSTFMLMMVSLDFNLFICSNIALKASFYHY